MTGAVHFVTVTGNGAPVRRLAADAGAALGGWLRTRAYGEASRPDAGSFAPGAYVFADLDRLDDDPAFRAMRLHERLAARDDVRCLNHPTRTLRRFELLRLIHDRGLNPLDVRRVEDRRMPRRWPVFLRTESDPLRRRPHLLRSADDLRAELERTERLGAYRPDLLVAELPGAGEGIGPVSHVLRIGRAFLTATDAGAGDPLAEREEGRRLRAIFELGRMEFGSLTLCRTADGPVVVDAGSGVELLADPRLRRGLVDALAALRASSG